LPRPTSRPGGGPAQSSRTTENITYQPSRTVKKIRLPSGTIRKMSVAVLVDQAVVWQKDKTGSRRVLVPPSADKLKVVHELVAGVTGFNATRGDQLVVETQPFETTLMLEPPGSSGPIKPESREQKFMVDRRTLWIAAGGAGALLAIGFATALLLRGRKKGSALEASAPAELPQGGALPPIEEQLEARLAEREALQQQMDAKALNALKLAPVITKTAEVMAKHIREKVNQEPEVSAQVLRSWIREEEG
jgi:flagellar M-ring protein FliF